jgi:hypothetical protein
MTSQLAGLWLQQCAIEKQDLVSWTRFDHNPSDSFGEALIHTGSGFALKLLSWQPGDFSAIHALPDCDWAAMRLFGTAELAEFAGTGGLLHTMRRRLVDPGSVVSLDAEMILQIGNRSQEQFVSLHLFGLPAQSDAHELQLHIYDLDDGQIQVARGAAHYLLPEGRIAGRLTGIRGDFPTWLRHNVELLARLDRMQPLDGRPGLATREARLLAEFNTADTWRALRQEMRMRLPGLEPLQQESYIENLTAALGLAGRMFGELHASGRFTPRDEVLELLGEIIAMLDNDDYIARIAGTDG